MKARAHMLSPSVACGIVILCAALFVAGAQSVRADSTPAPRATRTPTTVGFCGGVQGTCTPTATPTSTGTPTPTAVIHWTSHGPGGGDAYVLAFAIDPNAPTTLYAAAFGVGLFKSIDGAMSWQAANTGPSIPGLSSALAIDPATPTTLYGATGFCGGSDPGGCSGNGVFKSTDGGGSWRAADAGLDNPIVLTLAIDPTTPATLYAGALVYDAGGGGGGGLTAAAGAAVAAAMGQSVGVVFKSTDGAMSWHTADTGVPNDSQVRALAIDPKTPSTLYAGAVGGVFKSTDGATSWQAVSTGLSDRYVRAIAIDPETPSTLYAGAFGGVFKSTDGAVSWQAANTGLPGDAIVALAIDPKMPRTLYAGTYRLGVFKSSDGATSWQSLNAGLPNNITVNALAIDPLTPSILYAATTAGVFSIHQATAATVVGTGTAASCTNAALNTQLSSGGLVTFNCGADPVSIDISIGTGTKTIAADTTIDGGGMVTISGGNSVIVFVVNSGVKFTVKNLTIASGAGGGMGGGIHSDGTLTVTNSIFTGNSAGCAEIGHCGAGGAIVNASGSLTVTNSTFTGNQAQAGGGIWNASGSLTVTNSIFTGNSATGGGAIANAGTLTVSNSTFTDNQAQAGGGIYNAAGVDAGGLLTVTNSTFTGNSGGGIYNAGGDGVAAGTAVLRNTIVANSPSGGNCQGGTGSSITDGGHNLDSGTSCGFSAATGSLTNTDPQFDPTGLQDNGGPTLTVALCMAVNVPAGCTAASPTIDAGDESVCSMPPVNNLDQRGFVRPGTGHTQCSIGAYEADATAPEACVGDCSGNSQVNVDELIMLVNIALGNAQATACLNGVPSGADVNVALLIQAVNNALNGCAVLSLAPTRVPCGGTADGGCLGV